jgi:hypothetical protein
MDDTAPAVASEWNASEALYAFMGWLTSRYERTVLSATDDAAPAADLIGAFCKRHDLPKPREGWHRVIVPEPSKSAVQTPPTEKDPL